MTATPAPSQAPQLGCSEVSEAVLASSGTPLPEEDRARLREYWSHVIEGSYAAAGEVLPAPRFNAAARAERRQLRRRTARLVQALAAAQRQVTAADGEAA